MRDEGGSLQFYFGLPPWKAATQLTEKSSKMSLAILQTIAIVCFISSVDGRRLKNAEAFR